jgi:hypothetical protein
MSRHFCIQLFFVLAFLHGWLPCAHAQQLVEKIDDVIGKVLQHEEFQGTAAVIVGGFQLSVPQQDLHAGSGIKQMIVECLQRHNVKVEKRGRFPAISGQYCYAAADNAQIDINLFLNDREGAQLETYPVRVKFSEDNHQVLNIAAPSSVKLLTKETGFQRGQSVVASLKQPQCDIHDGWVSAPGGEYSVAIACEMNGTYSPVQIQNDGGFAYCQMKMGQAYRIRVKNNTPYEAVATVTVDGLDVFTYAVQKAPGYLIAPNGGEQEINGWLINDRSADSFAVGRFAETPAAEMLGDAADAGVICVQFAAAWVPGRKPPDEGGTLGSSKVGTKRGPPVAQNVERVAREIGKIREVVSIRYGVDPPL